MEMAGADLAVANYSDYYVDGNPAVTILISNGDGTFVAASTAGSVSGPENGNVNARSLAIGDFNADGVADLAVTNAAVTTILLGNGNGTFTAAAVQPAGRPKVPTRSWWPTLTETAFRTWPWVR